MNQKKTIDTSDKTKETTHAFLCPVLFPANTGQILTVDGEPTASQLGKYKTRALLYSHCLHGKGRLRVYAGLQAYNSAAGPSP